MRLPKSRDVRASTPKPVNAHGRQDATYQPPPCEEVRPHESKEDADPSEPIQHFDWLDLEERYHRKINALDNEELEIMRGFGDLCQVTIRLSVISPR